MAVTFNLKSSKIGKVGTLASVANGTNAVVDVVDTTIGEMNEGVVERDPEKTLATLLKELGIEGDKEKLSAFQDLVASLKRDPVQIGDELSEVVKKSKIFELLGKTERVVGFLSSAATIGTAVMSVLPWSI